MNLYKLHKKPEELNHYNVAHKRVPSLIVNKAYTDHDGPDGEDGHEDLARLKSEIKAQQKHIAKDTNYTRWYVKFINDGERWKEGEKHLKNDPYEAAIYAHQVIKGRLKEAEPYIAKDPRAASYYAEHVIKKPWPAGEEAILKAHVRNIYRYAANLLCRRWPEAEPILAKSNDVAKLDYENRFKIKL